MLFNLNGANAAPPVPWQFQLSNTAAGQAPTYVIAVPLSPYVVGCQPVTMYLEWIELT